MANTLLTPDMITREALRILHQKLNFVGNINRQYDDSFAKDGAKIGDALRIRLPNRFNVRSGATMGSSGAANDVTETSTTLTINKQKGVDMYFGSAELTLKLDDFSSRIIEPAMSVLAANIESDAFSMYKDVAQQTNTAGTPMTTLLQVLEAGARLDNSLAPRDNNRKLLVNPTAQAKLVDAVKGLFQDSSKISEQYRDGIIGRAAGFDWYTNTMMPTYASTNAALAAAATSVTAITEGSSTFTCAGVTGQTLAAGAVITFSNVFEVHPETRETTGRLMQFVVTNSIVAATSLFTGVTVSPAWKASATDPQRNVNIIPIVGTSTVTSYSGGLAVSSQQNLAFHKDAFCFATADLIMPKGVDFASRQVMDGISMRVVRAYDIVNDQMPCRIDVLYGYKTIRPQLATRISD